MGILSTQRVYKAHTQVIMLVVKQMKVSERIYREVIVNWFVILMGTIKREKNHSNENKPKYSK